MKVVARPIDVVSWTDTTGTVHPIRFRYMEKDESYKVIKINRIIQKNLEKLCGNPMIIYRCSSVIDGAERLFELKYEVNSCKWILFKI